MLLSSKSKKCNTEANTSWVRSEETLVTAATLTNEPCYISLNFLRHPSNKNWTLNVENRVSYTIWKNSIPVGTELQLNTELSLSATTTNFSLQPVV